MDFDIEPLSELVAFCHPKWVNIGADSQGHNLPEPDYVKVMELVAELGTFTEVKEKRNL
ncbi:unnamed protein product, partial [marine sediment metagenome]